MGFFFTGAGCFFDFSDGFCGAVGFSGIPVVFGEEEIIREFMSTYPEGFFFFIKDAEGGVSCCYIVEVLIFAFFYGDPFLEVVGADIGG